MRQKLIYCVNWFNQEINSPPSWLNFQTVEKIVNLYVLLWANLNSIFVEGWGYALKSQNQQQLKRWFLVITMLEYKKLPSNDVKEFLINLINQKLSESVYLNCSNTIWGDCPLNIF